MKRKIVTTNNLKAFDSLIAEEDLAPIIEVLRKGKLGFGPNVTEFEKQFASFSNKRYNVATNSASAAAYMIFAYLYETLGPCEVYTTSLGFTSPAWAAHTQGHTVVFVDVDDHLQFSTSSYKKLRASRRNKTSPKPVVLMPVLYGGVSTIDGFDPAGDEVVVVDSAHCVTPTLPSDFVFFSFHPYKPICSPDGGLIGTNDSKAENYFRSYRNFGRISSGSSYDVNQAGFKFYMNNLSATVALTQLPRYEEKLAHRKATFAEWAERYKMIPQDKHSSYYLGTTLVPNADDLTQLIGAPRHYPMLHTMTYYKGLDTPPLLHLEKIHSQILNLPLYRYKTPAL